MLDFDSDIRDGYNVLTFDDYSYEWFEFIADSRTGKKPWSGFDVIEWCVANDKVIANLARDFPTDVAIGRLKYTEPTNLIAI